MKLWLLIIYLMNADGTIADYGITQVRSEQECAKRREDVLSENDIHIEAYCMAVPLPKG